MTSSIRQCTIAHEVKVSGIGVHSGLPCTMTVSPAQPNAGIQFSRSDISPENVLKATVDAVTQTAFSTNIGNALTSFYTVEHLLSALYGLGIDNALISMNEAEVPILDGSSGDFVFLLKSAGRLLQDIPKKCMYVTETIRIEESDSRYIQIKPHKSFHVDMQMDLQHLGFPDALRQSYDEATDSYELLIARARTFGQLSQYKQLFDMNLSQGAGMNNVVIFGHDGPINDGGLRFSDEPCRHKILDLIGDLSLLGCRIVGKVEARNTGHALNHKLALALRDAIIEMPAQKISNAQYP